MPTKVQIDGVGTVEFDDSFGKLSPAEQQAAVDEVANSHAQSASGPAAEPAPPMPRVAPVPGQSFNQRVATAFANRDQTIDRANAATGTGQAWSDAATAPITAATSTLGIPGDVVSLAGRGISALGAPGIGEAINQYSPLPTSATLEQIALGSPSSPQEEAFRQFGRIAGPSAITSAPRLLRVAAEGLGIAAPVVTKRIAKEARALKLVISPRSASNNPSLTSTILSGMGGKVKLSQDASAINQPRVNELYAQDLELPKGTNEVTDSAINSVRSKAGKAYDAVANAVPKGVRLKLDDTFQTTIGALGTKGIGAEGRISPPVNNPEIDQLKAGLLNDFGPDGAITGPKVGFSPAQAITEVRTLRQEATAIYKMNNRAPQAPQLMALAEAKSQAADAIDAFVERRLTQIGKPGLVADYRKARTLFAKSYDAEAVTSPGGDVSASRLATLYKTRPLSGNAEAIARIATEHPKDFQSPTKFGNPESWSVLDIAGAVVGTAGAFHNPALAGLIVARPTIRRALLSQTYQNSMMAPPRTLGLSALAPSAAATGLNLTQGGQ